MHGTTQNDDSFHGLLSNKNNPCTVTAGSDRNKAGFFFAAGDELHVRLTTSALSIRRLQDGETRRVPVENAERGRYRLIVMATQQAEEPHATISLAPAPAAVKAAADEAAAGGAGEAERQGAGQGGGGAGEQAGPRRPWQVGSSAEAGRCCC